MLFRRISKHVKDQNWFAVGIDFVIVVIGVVIGIEVANWNDARADRLLGKDYVQRLVAELETDLANAQMLSKYYDTVLDNVIAADGLLADTGSDDQAVVVAAYRASEIAINPINRATWDQIVSAGHLGLLPQAAFDSGLTGYYSVTGASYASTTFLEGSDYRQAVRSVIPLTVQLALRENCSDDINSDGFITGFRENCRLNVPADDISATASALRTSLAVRQHLLYQFSLVGTVSTNYTQDTVLIQRILAALK
ncbi:MAG: hypothetical protein AAGC71_06915 [Pseudomonadota bacterium]